MTTHAPTIDRPAHHPRARDMEWLLTTGTGGYAMGTPLARNRRKYHALLVAPLAPPVRRLACLNDVRLSLSTETREHEPLAADHLIRFTKHARACTWHYATPLARLDTTLTLDRDTCAATIRVNITSTTDTPLTLTLAPLLTLRDSHDVLANPSLDEFDLIPEQHAFAVTRAGNTLRIESDTALFAPDPSLADPVRYDHETLRGYPDTERLYRPGAFTAHIDPGAAHTLTLTARLVSAPASSPPPPAPDITHPTPAAARLALAADDFLVTRTVGDSRLTTIVAGYPWFTDWGRDTMISLPGLLLTTHRFDEALACLRTFAAHTSRGMIPNVFDDRTGEPHYNTVDASLWFIHACCEYLRATNDRRAFTRDLLPACLDIVTHYRAGTRFGIREDPADSLVTAGDESTQLTWMDARRDGIVFTPRHGKAVEINALWHHAHMSLAHATRPDDAAGADALVAHASRIAGSFNRAFWNERDRCLFDCLQPDAGAWCPVAHIRPNQVFAASLRFSPLPAERRRAVVRCARTHLLTPMGLRTLAPNDPAFEPRFEGDMLQRDRAYHNGTAWPWLIGPWCEALLRAYEFSPDAVAQARAAIEPLLRSLDDGCLGQVAEVFDAIEPQREGGCPAQAWSVAELLRIEHLIASA